MSSNGTLCTQVGHLNPIYCGLRHQWTPRFSSMATGACVALPAAFSMICTMAGIPIIWRHFRKIGLYEKEMEEMRRRKSDTPRWLPPKFDKFRVWFFVFVIPVFPLLWDTVDVVLDGLYFYNMEQGLMISRDITRNTAVNNALLAFGILGALKTPFLILLIGRFWDILASQNKSDFTLMMVATSPTAIGDLYITILVYLTEDCALLFLEYFWIEKYIADHPSSIVILRNLISGVISCMPVIRQFVKLKDKWYIADKIDDTRNKSVRRKDCKHVCFEEPKEHGPKNIEDKSKRQKIYVIWIALSVVSLMGNIGSFLRTIGSVYQIITHKVPKPCLKVTSEGLLYQTPFNDECLRRIDYAILFFNFLPVLMYVFAWVVYTGLKIITCLYCGILDSYANHHAQPLSNIEVNIQKSDGDCVKVSIYMDKRNITEINAE